MAGRERTWSGSGALPSRVSARFRLPGVDRRFLGCWSAIVADFEKWRDAVVVRDRKMVRCWRSNSVVRDEMRKSGSVSAISLPKHIGGCVGSK